MNYYIFAGGKSERMNVHLLRHLVLHVKHWGPLWAYSCFPFESLNGDIKKFFHGTRNMSEQVNFVFCSIHNNII